jgi:hypothetical protein
MSATRSEATSKSGAAEAASRFTVGAARGLQTTWAFLRGPGWAATWKAMNQTEAFLAKVEGWIREALRRKPEPEPEPPPPELHPRLRFSDLDIDDPEDALHALRRAARTPPHRRHIEGPREE